MNRIFVILIVLLTLLTSCSKHIYVNYQVNSENTGEVKLKPTRYTNSTLVTIDDNLIVDRKNVKSVTIKNIPEGSHNIKYSAADHWYKSSLDVEIKADVKKGKKITKIVEVPPYSTGYWIYQAATFLGTWGVLLLLL